MTSLVQFGHGFNQSLGIGPCFAHGLGEGDGIRVKAFDSFSSGVFSDLGESFFKVFRGSEHLFTTGALSPVAFEEFATRRADIGRERLRTLVFLFAGDRDLGLLDVILFEEVGVGHFEGSGSLGMAEQHLDRVGVQVVVSLEDSSAVVPEVVRVDGLVNAGFVRESREHLVGCPLCPMASLVGLTVGSIRDEEPVVVSGVLPVVLDVVSDVLRSAEHRPFAAADSRTLETAELLFVLVVEVEIAILGVNIAHRQRDESSNSLAGENQQFEEGTIADGESRVSGGVTERANFVLGEHVRLVVLGRTVALVDDDIFGVNADLSVPEERLRGALVVDHSALGLPLVVVHGVHAVVELLGSRVEKVNAGLGRELQTTKVVFNRAGLQRLQFAVRVEVLVSDSIFVQGVPELQERVPAGVGNGSLVGKRFNATFFGFKTVAGCVGHGNQSDTTHSGIHYSVFSAQSARRTVAIPLCERGESTPYSTTENPVSAGNAPSAIDASSGVAA